MIPPHDPTRYRNHGEEIQAALQWRADMERADAINRQIAECEAVADKLLKILAFILLVAVLGVSALGLFRFAIDRAEAMPRYIEGVE